MYRTFIVLPWVTIRPIHKLLVYPSEEAHRRVGQGVPERLGLRTLLRRVSPTEIMEPLGAL
jgi:hypothetical protein